MKKQTNQSFPKLSDDGKFLIFSSGQKVDVINYEMTSTMNAACGNSSALDNLNEQRAAFAESKKGLLSKLFC